MYRRNLETDKTVRIQKMMFPLLLTSDRCKTKHYTLYILFIFIYISFYCCSSGYLTMRVQNKQKDLRPEKYIIKASDHNPLIPSNLFLMPGDHTLELTIKRVDEMR